MRERERERREGRRRGRKRGGGEGEKDIEGGRERERGEERRGERESERESILPPSTDPVPHSHLGEESIEAVNLLSLLNKGVVLGNTLEGELFHEIDLVWLVKMPILGQTNTQTQ